MTFRYTEQGPKGCSRARRSIVVLARGGRYRDTPADTQVPYLKTVLASSGMTDIEVVYAEGLAMGPQAEAEALAAARARIDELVTA